MSIFRTRMPAYVYLTTDGALPRTPPGSGIDTRAEIVSYWHGQTTFVNGLSQETCRDSTRTGYGLASAAHIAETARHQGQDLWDEVRDRLRHADGLHAKYQSTRLGIPMTNTRPLTECHHPLLTPACPTSRTRVSYIRNTRVLRSEHPS